METTSNFKTKDFTRSYLVDTLGLPHDKKGDLVKVLVNKLEDSSRWTLDYNLVFQLVGEDVFYQVYYSIGATEMQYLKPWEYEDIVTATIVEPKEVTVIEYIPIKR